MSFYIHFSLYSPLQNQSSFCMRYRTISDATKITNDYFFVYT